MNQSGLPYRACFVAISTYISLALRAHRCSSRHTIRGRYSLGPCLATSEPPTSMAMPLSISPKIRTQRSVARSIQGMVHYPCRPGQVCPFLIISYQWAPWTASMPKSLGSSRQLKPRQHLPFEPFLSTDRALSFPVP